MSQFNFSLSKCMKRAEKNFDILTSHKALQAISCTQFLKDRKQKLQDRPKTDVRKMPKKDRNGGAVESRGMTVMAEQQQQQQQVVTATQTVVTTTIATAEASEHFRPPGCESLFSYELTEKTTLHPFRCAEFQNPVEGEKERFVEEVKAEKAIQV